MAFGTIMPAHIFHMMSYLKSNGCTVDYFCLDQHCGSTEDKEYFRNLFYVPTMRIVFFFHYCVVWRQANEYYSQIYMKLQWNSDSGISPVFTSNSFRIIVTFEVGDMRRQCSKGP